MENKNGFTLVELLAVIAILAILVIIALPNVIGMYNRAQKQMFLTEAKKVYSEAEKKYLTNAISGKNTKIINSEDSSKLDMTGKKLQYCVVLNSGGKVTDMKVSNGKWVASLNGKALEDLTIDDLEDGNLDDYECVSATDESCFDYTMVGSDNNIDTLTVTIEDSTKCKNYLISNNAPEDAATIICNGGTYTQHGRDFSIKDLVSNGIPEEDYEKAGLKVTLSSLDISGVTITGYNVNCGTDVIIPQKINGYKVTGINNYAFESCYGKSNLIIDDSQYKINYLNNKSDNEYPVAKLNAYCISKRLTSITLPNTLVYIGSYAFSYNVLTDVVIPSSVRYIGDGAFGYNNIKTVTYNGNESNITFGDCPYYENYDYSGRYKNCRPE